MTGVRSSALCLLLVSGTSCEGRIEPVFRPVDLVVAPAETAEPVVSSPRSAPLLPQGDYEGTIRLDPADLATATFEVHPTVGVPVRHLSDEQLASLVSRFHLVTWPEGESVETVPVYLDEGTDAVEYSRISLEPVQPLADRWYAIRGELTGDERVASVAYPTVENIVVSRFRIGSMPTLRRIVATNSSDSATGGTVELSFSELVHLEPGLIRVEVDGRSDPTCTLDSLPSGGATTARLRCADVREGRAIAISFLAPLVSVQTGVALRSADGAALGRCRLDGEVHTLRAGVDPAGRSTVVEHRVPVHIPSFGLAGIVPSLAP